MGKSGAVAVIEPVGGHGGMDYYDIGLCQGLIAAGWKVSWYTCAETKDPFLPSLRFSPIFRGIWGKSNRWKRAVNYLLGALFVLAAAIRRREKLCHLHFFHGAPEELLLFILAKLARRRVVITVHDIESFGKQGAVARKVVSRAYRLANALIVHNAVSKRELERVLGAKHCRIAIIPHGNYFDAIGEMPTTAAARSKLKIDESAQVILFFGQIKDVKGLDILLQAMPTVVRNLPNVILLIAGRPWKSDFHIYESAIEDLGIRGRCKLHIRYILDDEVAWFYSAADIVVLPYRHIYQSGVVLLSMSYGKPVLVSDIPGMTEVVTHDRNGFVFLSGSAPELARELIRALKDEGGRVRVALNALEYVRTKHDWQEIGKKTVNLYQSVLP